MAQRRREFSGIALIAAGFVLVALTATGYFVGAAIDRKLGTGSRWALIGLLVGFLVGFWDLYVIAARLLSNQPYVPPLPPEEEPEETDQED